jgi:cytochrome o ubiquinol oxidase subunit I
MQHYDVASWQPWLIVAALGVMVIFAGIVCQVIQLVVSIRNRKQLKAAADPWNGRTLEWATTSPPPSWNFAVVPHVTDVDEFWKEKQRLLAHQTTDHQVGRYAPIEMPKNSPIGFVIAFFAVVCGFALIWHIWWMAALGAIGILLAVLVFAFREQDEIEIPAESIAHFEVEHRAEMAA